MSGTFWYQYIANRWVYQLEALYIVTYCKGESINIQTEVRLTCKIYVLSRDHYNSGVIVSCLPGRFVIPSFMVLSLVVDDIYIIYPVCKIHTFPIWVSKKTFLWIEKLLLFSEIIFNIRGRIYSFTVFAPVSQIQQLIILESSRLALYG